MTKKSEHAAPLGGFCTLPDPLAGGEPGGAVDNASAGAAVRIYGKADCPHTRRAREAMPDAVFLDVLGDPATLDEMLRLSGGERRIPVIVRGRGASECVEIGFRRGS
jgi:glutaredoxin 3